MRNDELLLQRRELCFHNGQWPGCHSNDLKFLAVPLRQDNLPKALTFTHMYSHWSTHIDDSKSDSQQNFLSIAFSASVCLYSHRPHDLLDVNARSGYTNLRYPGMN